MINRTIIVVLDSFGVGEAPDSKDFGDDELRSKTPSKSTMHIISDRSVISFLSVGVLKSSPCS